MSESEHVKTPLQSVLSVLCDALCTLSIEDQQRALEAARITLGITAPDTEADQRLRINTQMFEGTIRVLSQQNTRLHEQVAALRANPLTSEASEEDSTIDRLGSFLLSLRPEQLQAIRGELNHDQLIAFSEIANVALRDATPVAESEIQGRESLDAMISGFLATFRPTQMQGLGFPITIEGLQQLSAAQIHTLGNVLDMQQKMMLMEILTVIDRQRAA